MKKTLPVVLFILWAAVSSVVAQTRFDPGVQLSPEESQMIQEFRRNPEPFRQLMLGLLSRPAGGPLGGNAVLGAEPVAILGPRDVIDVVISGGEVAFWGKRRTYEPVSFRIVRGDKQIVSFFRGDSSAETRVTVAFKSDGLHFDVPDAFDGNPRHVQGFLVVPESNAWKTGEPFTQEHPIDEPRSTSRARGISVKVQYAASMGDRTRRGR